MRWSPLQHERWAARGLVAGALVALLGLGLVTWHALRIEAGEARARRESAEQESLRLALWRIDSIMTPILAREAARPYFEYQPFYPADRAYTNFFTQVAPNEVLVPSPLLTSSDPLVNLYFQRDAMGSVASPQVPVGAARTTAEGAYLTPYSFVQNAQRLARFQTLLRDEQSMEPTNQIASAPPLAARARQASPANAPRANALEEPTASKRSLERSDARVPVGSAMGQASTEWAHNAHEAVSAPQAQAGASMEALRDNSMGEARDVQERSSESASESSTESSSQVPEGDYAARAAVQKQAQDLGRAQVVRPGRGAKGEEDRVQSPASAPAPPSNSLKAGAAGVPKAEASVRDSAGERAEPLDTTRAPTYAAAPDRANGRSMGRGWPEATPAAQLEARTEAHSEPLHNAFMDAQAFGTDRTGGSAISNGWMPARIVAPRRLGDALLAGNAPSDGLRSLSLPWLRVSDQDDVVVSDFQARWVVSRVSTGMPELVLRRSVRLGTQELEQGLWMNWERLRAMLLSGVRDLFPSATLRPVTDDVRSLPSATLGRMLASIPAELVVPRGPAVQGPAWTPLRVALLVTWLLVLLSLGGLVLAMRALADLAARRGQFVSAVTHELRTPLTTFRMYSEMLASGMVRDEATKREYVRTLASESDRLGRIVESVLEYARLGRGERARVQPTTLARLRARIDPVLDAIASAHGLELTHEPPIVESGQWRDEGVAMRTDASRLERVLANLVENAGKYGRDPDGRTRARVVWSVQPGSMVVRVLDDGPGIPSGEVAGIFSPFTRGQAHAHGATPGMGLGLALARALTEQLGGSLTYEAGQPGATFVVRVPV